MNNRKNSSGVALVLVLAFLVIISALVVAFFASTTTELRASRNFGSLVSARQLADSAVTMVERQIRDATTQGINSAGQGNYAWASQPGMLRVFGSNGAVSSNPYAYYKLYSSNSMVVSAPSATWTPANDLPPAGISWQKQPALYTDLNAPVTVTDPTTQTSQQVFPIMDGNNLGTFTNSHGNKASTYLNAANAQLVEGFEVDTSDTHLAYSSSAAVSAANNPVAMPVSWLYVLKDGTITWPSGVGATSTSVKWDKGAGPAPTKANPIVGRMAFWADDDSSKVNINTAAGSAVADPSILKIYPAGYNEFNFAGSFWDTPRFNTQFDKGNIDPLTGELVDPDTNHPGGLAACQLAQNEYQRYPGHPSTTSLGVIFKNLLTSEQIYHLAPRIQYDDHTNNQRAATSQGGTWRLRRYDATNQNNPPPTNPENDLYAVQIKSDRLYASVDELLYASFNIQNQSSPQNGQSGIRQRYTNDSVVVQNSPQPAIDTKNGTITPALINRLHFFLSANNRAPEINLFGQPRVAIWPVYGATSYSDEAQNGDDLVTNRNAYDRQIAFCATVGGSVTASNHLINGRRYMFTRNKPLDTTYDINLPRNSNILTYLKNMTSAARGIPGFGSPSFESKYKIQTPVSAAYAGQSNRDLILAEMFDYIRCANMKDTTSINGSTANTNYYAPTGTIAPSRVNLFGNWKDASNPTPNAGLASGVGRFSTISEATLVFYCSGVDRNALSGGNTSVKNRYVRAFLLLSTFDPLQGYAPISDPSTKSELQVFDVTGLDALQISPGGAGSYTPLGFPATAQNKVYYSSAGAWGGRNFGGYEGFMHTLFRGPSTASPAPDPQYRLQSGTPGYLQPYNAHDLDNPTLATVTWQGVPIPGNITTIDFKGGPVTLKVSLGAQASGAPQLLQTITLNFPSGSGWPVPRPWYRANGDPAAFVPPSGPYTAGGVWFKAGGGGSGDAAKPAPGTTTRWQSALSYDGRFHWAGQTSPGAGSVGDGDWYSSPGVLVDHEGNRSYQMIQPGDVARSLVFGSTPKSTSNLATGFDLRLAAVSPIITAPASQTATTPGFYQHPDWNTNRRFATTLRRADGGLMANFPAGSNYSDYEAPDPINKPSFVAFTEVTQLGNHVKLGSNVFISQGQTISVPYSGWNGGGISLGAQGGVNGVGRSIDTGPGDFDNGIGIFPDGPFCNKEDEGNVVFQYYDSWAQKWYYPVPYYTWSYQVPGNTFYTPNRQAPSPVMFGSLPSRPGDGRSWETLCFSPNPAALSAAKGFVHPGKDSLPNDELLLDLFSMPQVEPYSISEPFSTAGKVNLNYSIAPFGYITRNTALRAALQSVRVTAVPTADSQIYKNTSVTPTTNNYRLPLDRDQTILGYDNFLSTNDAAGYPNFFKSASQICERFLYPKYLENGNSATNFGFSTPENSSGSKIYSFWNKYALTGDNEREKPYCDLYSRVTTKSNTYTVHYRVQPLIQRNRANPTDYATWDDVTDSVAGESRGSTTIERTLDSNDPRFTSTSKNFIDPDLVSLETYYRFRVLANKKFAP